MTEIVVTKKRAQERDHCMLLERLKKVNLKFKKIYISRIPSKRTEALSAFLKAITPELALCM